MTGGVESSLAVRYPTLFRFCRNKEASVAELMLFANDVLFWDVSFFRGVHVRDLEALSDFMISIYDSPLRGSARIKCVGLLTRIRALGLGISIKF